MATPILNPGLTLGHFRLIEKIGAGGFGIVYRARDTRLERDVAVKVLNAKSVSNEPARKQFRREALILSRLNHPNIEAVYDFHSDQGVDYLVMEYVPGVCLNQRLEQGALPEKEVLELGIELARGLAAAHAQGIIHRDLKPGNLRVNGENVLKILDFGLAQLYSAPEATTLTETTTELLPPLAGTPAYMAPEQLQWQPPDTRSDLYSAGTVLYELATGSKAFPQQGQMLYDAILHSLPPAPRLRNKDISPELESAILKCLEKDPELRYQSANDLLEDLKELARGSGPLRALEARPRQGWWSSRRLVIGLALIVVLVAGIVFRIKLLEWFGIAAQVPAVKHVAVLPFHLSGAQPQEAALLDGLTDTVTNRLMQLTAAQPVGIIPFSEITAHHVNSMQEARAQLGANLALDGNLQHNGNQIQVNLALADIESHKQLRADSVTGAAADFEKLEDKVVDAAVSMLELELHKNPPKDEAHATTSPEAYEAFTRGRGYLSRSSTPENLDSAISQFGRALELDPGYAAAYAALGRTYWDKYRLTKDEQWIPKMRDTCERSQKMAPSSSEANVCLGMLEEGTGHYEQAASDFQLALDADPTNDLAYNQLASAYEELGRLPLAEKTYQKAIQIRPENPSSYIPLGTLYAHETRYREAAAQFETAAKLAPDVADTWKSLGGVYLEAGQYAKAESALQKAINLQPSYKAYWNLGQAYFFQRKFEDAINAFNRSVLLGDQHIEAHGNLARAYYWYPPKRAQAKAELKRAIELAGADLRVNPNNADVHTLLAEYFAMLGDRMHALEHLQAALASRPLDPETLFYAAKVYNILGEREQALNWLEKSVKSGYSLAEIQNTVELDSLRADPRFQALTSEPH